MSDGELVCNEIWGAEPVYCSNNAERVCGGGAGIGMWGLGGEREGGFWGSGVRWGAGFVSGMGEQ